jgi:hypothetical protein
MAIEGFIEDIQPTQIRGWAFRPERPDEQLDIVVSSGASVIAEARADLFRSDLKKAGVGGGDHAFVINFPEALDDAIAATVSVEARSDEMDSTILYALATPPSGSRLAVTELDVEAIREWDGQHSPVFVLGAARSGTSAMAQALLGCGYYTGFEEGHLLGLAHRLTNATGQYYEENGDETLPGRSTLLGRVPRQIIDEGIKDVFRTAARFMYPAGRWVDKTPTLAMIRAAPLMLDIWPRAKFIFMKRRAIENIDSRLRKFPELAFAEHCDEWCQAMKAWRDIREILAGAALEVEQLEVARAPDKIGLEVSSFLDIPSAASRRLTDALRVERPQRTSQQFASTMALQTVDWSPQQVDMFKNICLDEMDAFGYSVDESYFAAKS